MKLIALLALVTGNLFVSAGCHTPAYSAQERRAMIARNQRYEWRQAVDDWDHFWLLRPPSQLTVWHVR